MVTTTTADVIQAPLDANGKLDPDLWREKKAQCTVRRFHPRETAADGWLRVRGDNWYFWYDEEDEGAAEPVFKLGAHELRPGQYVTVREGDGDVLDLPRRRSGPHLAKRVRTKRRPARLRGCRDSGGCR